MKQNMVNGSIVKSITYFAIPIFLGNLFQQLYNTADSIIVGNTLGSQALAAVSSSGSLIFMLIGFFSGIAIGAGVVISRLFGSKDFDKMSDAIHTTIAFGLVSGIVMTIIGVALSPTILAWMDTPSEVMPESITYLRIYFCGTLFAIMYNVFVGILQAVGDSKSPLYFLIISSIVNVILDLFFIMVLKMGVGGAALATIISQFVSAALCLKLLLSTHGVHNVQLRKIRFHKVLLKDIIMIGLPSGLQNSVIAFANVVVQSNVNYFGDYAMAGVGAYAKIEGFGFLPITSFTMALTTFISQNIGAMRIDRVKKGIKFGVITTVILSEIIGLVIFVLAPLLIRCFDQNPTVIEFGVAKTRTSALFFFLLAFSHALSAVFRGRGKSVVPMLVMLICWCVIRVTFLEIMVPITNDIQTVYYVYPLTWLLSSIFFIVYYLFNRKSYYNITPQNHIE